MANKKVSNIDDFDDFDDPNVIDSGDALTESSPTAEAPPKKKKEAKKKKGETKEKAAVPEPPVKEAPAAPESPEQEPASDDFEAINYDELDMFDSGDDEPEIYYISEKEPDTDSGASVGTPAENDSGNVRQSGHGKQHKKVRKEAYFEPRKEKREKGIAPEKPLNKEAAQEAAPVKEKPNNITSDSGGADEEKSAYHSRKSRAVKRNKKPVKTEKSARTKRENRFLTWISPREDGSQEPENGLWSTFLFFALLAAALNFLAALYVTQSKNIYFWDDATYWDIARHLADHSGSGFWRDVYSSIMTEDYNYTAGIISSIFVRWFGESRLVYVLGILNCYMLPALICVYFLAKRIGKSPKTTVAISVMLCPSIAFMTFRGFVDVGGLIMCLCCYLIYYGKNDEQCGAGGHMLIGALLAALVIWRRWYAYFALSFITAMLVDSIMFKRKWYMPLVTVFAAAAIIVFGFRDFLLGKLLTNYSELYSDYKYPFSIDVKLVMRYFGIATLAALAAGSAAIGIREKDSRTLMPWVQIAVCFAMFTATQTHGQQHLLLYIPSIIVLIILITRRISDERILAAIFVLMMANSVNICIPRQQPNNIQEIKHYALIPDFSMLPIVRNDVYDILSLKNNLDSFINEGETLGVVASSFKLNEDILRNVEPSLGYSRNRVNYISGLPQVDSRDKDLSSLYSVNYMLVAYPVQTHLAEGSQTVVTRAVESFALMSDFAASFEELPDSESSIDDITLKLYRRVGEVTEEQKREFESKLYVNTD